MSVLLGFCRLFGWDPVMTGRAVKGVFVYLRNRRKFSKTMEADFPYGIWWPCLNDRYAECGTAKGDYFHQDLWVAQRVFAHSPQRHIDVGSRIDGFVAHVAAFRSIEVLDIRPLTSTVPNITFRQVDFSRPLDESYYSCCDSVSCLHAMEHFGLGRYGDPVDSTAWRRGVENLRLMLKPGGKLYFSVPMGPQRVEFDAHRVFATRFLIDLFSPHYTIDRFSYVDDAGDLHANVSLDSMAEVNANFGCYRGCGIFEMTKK